MKQMSQPHIIKRRVSILRLIFDPIRAKFGTERTSMSLAALDASEPSVGGGGGGPGQTGQLLDSVASLRDGGSTARPKPSLAKENSN